MLIDRVGGGVTDWYSALWDCDGIVPAPSLIVTVHYEIVMVLYQHRHWLIQWIMRLWWYCTSTVTDCYSILWDCDGIVPAPSLIVTVYYEIVVVLYQHRHWLLQCIMRLWWYCTNTVTDWYSVLWDCGGIVPTPLLIETVHYEIVVVLYQHRHWLTQCIMRLWLYCTNTVTDWYSALWDCGGIVPAPSLIDRAHYNIVMVLYQHRHRLIECIITLWWYCTSTVTD
jgi:hypothetical protein